MLSQVATTARIELAAAVELPAVAAGKEVL